MEQEPGSDVILVDYPMTGLAPSAEGLSWCAAYCIRYKHHTFSKSWDSPEQTCNNTDPWNMCKGALSSIWMTKSDFVAAILEK